MVEQKRWHQINHYHTIKVQAYRSHFQLSVKIAKESAVFLTVYSILEEPGKRSQYSDWLRAGRLRGRSSSPGRFKNFLHVVQTDSEVHPISYPMSTGGSFPGGKAGGA
jgi:hypothetical protein